MDPLTYIKSISFRDKYWDLNNDVYDHGDGTTEPHINAKFKCNGNYPTTRLNLINDNEWHTATVLTHDELSHSDLEHFQIGIQHFYGEIYIADMKINSYREELNLRNFDLGTLNYGNTMRFSTERNNVGPNGCDYQINVKPNLNQTLYNSIGLYSSEAISLSENDSRYVEMNIYVDSTNVSDPSTIKNFKFLIINL